jgi:hypothetical protein
MLRIKQPKIKLINPLKNLLLISLLFMFMLSSAMPYILAAQGTEPTVISASNQTMLRAAVNAAVTDGPVIIVFENDITLTGTALTIPNNAYVTLKSNSTLASEANVEFFKLIGASGATTIIVDNGGVLKIDGIIVTHARSNGRGIEINSDGVFELYSGAVSGNTFATGSGVFNKGTFKMYGGTVSDNTASSGNAGGVCNSGGNFVMMAGAISNNRAAVHGGGVENSGTFKMYGGEISDNTISGNPAFVRSGGGVYNSGNFVLEYGIISNNIAVTDGGGVCNVGTFTMNAGKVSLNTAGRNGGGIQSVSSNFTLSNIEISGNTANEHGGGVYYSGSSFALYDSTISNNNAIDGGGVWCSGVFDMSNVLISNNYASENGGGVYKYDSGTTLKMLNSEILGNIANNNGGGVYVNYGTFEMYSNSEISGNKALNGGGIYLSDGLVHLYNGRVFDNYANIGGGIWVTNTYGAALDRLVVDAGVEFSDNRANRGYDRLANDDVTYSNLIKSAVWSDPFSQGYNNYDISYVHSLPLEEFSVNVIGANPLTPKWPTYISNDTIRATVSIDAGIAPIDLVFKGWNIILGEVLLTDSTSPCTTFVMPNSSVKIEAVWGIAVDYNIYVSNGSGKVGDEVTLLVTLEDNPGISMYSLTMLYPSEIALVRVENGNILEHNFDVDTSVTGQIGVSAISENGLDVNSGTVLFSITFKIINEPLNGVINDLTIGLFRPNDAIEHAGNHLTFTPNQITQGQILVEPDAEYVIRYYIQDTTDSIALAKVVTGQTLNRMATENAIRIPGYNALAPTTLTAILNATDNEFIFYYTRDPNYALVHVKTENELTQAINEASMPTVIVLDNDITLTKTVTISGNKQITLTSNKIDTYDFFTLTGVHNAITITIERGTLTLDGVIVTHLPGQEGRGVSIYSTGTFIMVDGKISGNAAAWAGGGVYNNGGIFQMQGGIITNNNAPEYGGGVYNNDGSTFTMSGGIISDNTAKNGGGIFNRASLTMSGNAEISHNVAGYGGGGISSASMGTLTMTDNSVIHDNSAFIGGGVFDSGNFQMTGGTIANNIATEYGGGVYTNDDSTFAMLDGKIVGNTAKNGGGIYNRAVTTIAGNSEISNNNAGYGGGGISSASMGTLTMTDNSVIHGNSAVTGGGVFNSGLFKWYNGLIYGNNAGTNADIYVLPITGQILYM